MAISQAQIDALDDAIASGALEVRDGRREIRYRSLEEMKEARRIAQEQLNAAGGVAPVRRLRVALVR